MPLQLLYSLHLIQATSKSNKQFCFFKQLNIQQCFIFPFNILIAC